MNRRLHACDAAGGWHVCNGADILHSGLTYHQARQFEGCYLYDAAKVNIEPAFVEGSDKPRLWGEAMGDMIVRIRKGQVAQGMAAGVRDVGFVLSEHFPRGEDDENELPDRLIEV